MVEGEYFSDEILIKVILWEYFQYVLADHFNLASLSGRGEDTPVTAIILSQVHNQSGAFNLPCAVNLTDFYQMVNYSVCLVVKPIDTSV